MTYPFPDYSHVHISEREAAKYWPDGQYDPAGWEDCLWVAGVELYRFAGGRAPALLAEAEALRNDAGVAPAGPGSNHDGLRRGMLVRYGRSFRRAIGETELLALGPGHAAVVSGSLGRFADGHTLRRWDTDYVGGHAVVLYRVDELPRWWWCDGLAPTDGYSGQWVSDDQARQFMYDGSLFSWARLGEFQEAEMIPFVDARSRNVDLAAGVVLYDLARRPVRTLTAPAIDVVSPFIVDSTYRAAFATVDGQAQLVLIRKADATNVRVTAETAHLVELGKLDGRREEWDRQAIGPDKATVQLSERP
jgi:hypothetical protein